MQIALQAMLTDTVLHEAWTGQNAYGTPTYAPGVERLARVHLTTERFVNTAGQERVSQAVAYLPRDFPLQMRDRLTLPDGLLAPIQRIDAWEDEFGQAHHYKVYF